MICARLITGMTWGRTEPVSPGSPGTGCGERVPTPSAAYQVVVGELQEELVPVLLVVVDAEIATDVEVQQEPVRAVHLEGGVGVWKGRGGRSALRCDLGRPRNPAGQGRWQQDPHRQTPPAPYLRLLPASTCCRLFGMSSR